MSTPAGQALARLECELLRERLELLVAVLGVPRAHAAQVPLARIELPEGTQSPAQRPADRLQRRLVRLDRTVRFSEDPSHGMLHAAQRPHIGGEPPLLTGRFHAYRRRYTDRSADRWAA
jgi:hypothetical protein